MYQKVVCPYYIPFDFRVTSPDGNLIQRLLLGHKVMATALFTLIYAVVVWCLLLRNGIRKMLGYADLGVSML